MRFGAEKKVYGERGTARNPASILAVCRVERMRRNRNQWVRNGACLAMTLALPALNGCLWHTRRVQQAKMPENVLSAEPEQLVQIINKQYDAVSTISATVTFTATEGGTLKGEQTTYASFSGYIRLRKPDSLRVIGFLPVVHTRAFDMASNGDTFVLLIPPKNKVVEGTNTITKPSANALENLRPFIFFDSLLIRKIGPDDLLLVTTDSPTGMNPKTRKLEFQPEYLLTVLNREGGGNVLTAKRVIHFSRLNLRPIEEDIYGADGQVQTQTIYGPPQTFGTEQFPGTVTIKWPLQEQQILVTIQTLHINLPLEDSTFQMEIPKGMQVQQLK
jgi:outer membrane lipoprotein-sorting protein